MISDGWRGEGTVLFGGSGFVGTAILRMFPKMVSAGRRRPETDNRHVCVADLGDLSELHGLEFVRVICCVGTSRHVELMGRPLAESIEAHTMPSVQLLEQLRERPLRSFVRLSTVLLYDEATGPVDESSPIAPYRNRYLLGQYFGEQAARFYEQYFPVTTVRLCNLYGPWAGERTDLVHEIVAQMRAQGRARIRTRLPERDFLYGDDAARAVAALALLGESGVFNLGSGQAVSAGTIADTLSALSGCPVSCEDAPVTGVRSLAVNAEKLRRATGWAPQMPLDEGLARTYASGH